MSNVQLLDRPAIEDTLFGEPQATPAETVAAIESCFCICGCPTAEVKVANSQLSSANTEVGRPA